MEINNSIELRSENVRNIIGQIPPKIIRWGILIIFVIFVVIFAFACFFKFNPNVNVSATIEQQGCTIYYTILIPDSYKQIISPNQQIFFNYNLLNSNQKIESTVQNIDTCLVLTEQGLCFTITGNIITNITVANKITVGAQIVANQTNIINWLLNK